MTNEKIKDIGRQDVIDVNISEDLLDEMVAMISQIIEDGAPIQVLIMGIVGAYVANSNLGHDVRVNHGKGHMFIALREDDDESSPRVVLVNDKKKH